MSNSSREIMIKGGKVKGKSANYKMGKWWTLWWVIVFIICANFTP
jgi:hypothetical protein